MPLPPLPRRVVVWWLSVPVLFIALAATPGLSGVASAHINGIAAQGCDGCHSGGRAATVTLTATPDAPTVGQLVTLTLSVSQTNGPVAGFFLTTIDGKGTFHAIESGTAALPDGSGVTHTMPRTGSGGTTVFKVQWSAPQATGVQFAAYALSANGDGTNRGDGAGQAILSIVSGCTGMTYYIDQDGDGFGSSDPSYPSRKDCSLPMNYAAVAGDCNDFDATIYPGAPELCDGKDNNCDGKIDESVVSQKYCEDKDGDGHGVPTGASKMDCKPSPGFGDCNGDCNDNNAAVYPGAVEVCDGRDNNCNGNIDEGVRMTCGEGWCRRYAEGCTSVCTPGPPIVETCNYFDDDCDGVIDNGTDAELCGASGLACVVGKCVPASSSSTSGGGAANMSSATGGGSVGPATSGGGSPGGGSSSSASGAHGDTPAAGASSGGGCALMGPVVGSGVGERDGAGKRERGGVGLLLTLASVAWMTGRPASRRRKGAPSRGTTAPDPRNPGHARP